MKRNVIASLLRAGRTDLANVVAYRVTSKLVLPPRKIKPFVENLIKRLRKLDADAAAYRDWLNQMNRQYRASDGMSYNPVEDFRVIRQGGYGGQYGPGDIEYVLEIFEANSFGSGKRLIAEQAATLEQTWTIMQGWDSPRDQLNGVGYLSDEAKRAAEALERVIRNGEDFTRSGWVQDTFENYQNNYGEGYPVLVTKKDLLRLDRIMRDAAQLRDDLNDASARLAHMKSAALQRYNDPEWKPESEKVETLYHASVDAKRIFQRGAFDPKMPEPKGLGGSTHDKQHNPAISFTSDLYVAKEIARALKEAIMLARGEVTAADILDWSRRHGIIDDVERNFASNYGPLDPKKPAHVFDLYRIYLTFHKTRYNPVFFVDSAKMMQNFKRLKVSDVGVLKCKVDMSDPAISYHPAEHEYRIQPASVVSIDKLIR